MLSVVAFISVLTSIFNDLPDWIGIAFVFFMYGSVVPFLSALCLWPNAVQGICLNCDYNLTGTIAAGKATCPECGHVIAAGEADATSKLD